MNKLYMYEFQKLKCHENIYEIVHEKFEDNGELISFYKYWLTNPVRKSSKNMYKLIETDEPNKFSYWSYQKLSEDDLKKIFEEVRQKQIKYLENEINNLNQKLDELKTGEIEYE